MHIMNAYIYMLRENFVCFGVIFGTLRHSSLQISLIPNINIANVHCTEVQGFSFFLFSTHPHFIHFVILYLEILCALKDLSSILLHIEYTYFFLMQVIEYIEQ